MNRLNRANTQRRVNTGKEQIRCLLNYNEVNLSIIGRRAEGNRFEARQALKDKTNIRRIVLYGPRS